MRELSAKIKDVLTAAGYPTEAHQAEKLATYLDFLVEYNAKVNLTAITDEDDVIVKHFLDSLAAINDIPLHAKLADIGSGAGFPAVVLKIFRDDLDVTLIESNGKKVTFLNELIKKLELSGICTLYRRAEALGREEAHRERYDAVTARAVTEMRVLVEYSIPLLKLDGKLLAYKANVAEELIRAKRAIIVTGGELVVTRRYFLDEKYSRSLVVIRKCSPTPGLYPRANTKITNQPL